MAIEKRRRPAIHEWESEERPREKFLTKGASALTNAELLAILIRSGSPEANAVELAREILRGADNNLSELKKYNFDNFKKIKGIGLGKALSIMAAFELCKRLESEPQRTGMKIYSSENAAKAIAPFLKDLSYEECWALYLNRGNILIGKERISTGGVCATVMDSRIIHPSGNPYPGNEDKLQTQRLKKSAQICDIELIDHIIIAGQKYFSFLDEGLL